MALLLLFSLAASGKVGVTRLTVEGRTNPAGLDDASPRLGWQITSDKRGVRQTRYRVIVASDKEMLEEDKGDVWDSGDVRSDQSQWVALPATTVLRPNQVYYWKVSVGTSRGESGWSETAQWSTGLLSPDNFHGQWIGLDSIAADDQLTRHARLRTRYLRKTFATHKAVRRATVHISGLGCYLLFINGQRVGNDVLTPNGTDYTKTVIYNTYDVTSLIRHDNAIGVVLTGGHYLAPTLNYQPNVRATYGFPKVIADLIVEYADGSSEVIATDTTWRVSANGASRWANEYDGELYDSRKALTGWADCGYDDAGWTGAQAVAAPGGQLVGNISPAMSVYATEQPKSQRRLGRRHIVDFGTNNAGRVRIRLPKTVSGDTIIIRHAELLEPGDTTLYTDNLRGAEATARYVCNGQPAEWTPELTFYGFRYIEVTGTDSCHVERELIADRMDDMGFGFSAEEDGRESMLNAIVANARRGIRSNYKGMPIDCPQRDERMPWLGDRTMGCLGESYMMDNHALYAKWVRDICDGQREDGRISDVTPAYWRLYNKNITWPAALPLACDMLYRQYGDLRPMAGSYQNIKRFLEMIRRENYKDGLVPYDRYGDWCVPPESPKLVHSKDPARKTDGELISSAYYFYLCRLMSRYAAILAPKDTAWFQHEATVTREAINRKFMHDGTYSNSTVTACLLPLAMGIVPDSQRENLKDTLLYNVDVKNSRHVSSGVIGIQWLMRTLAAMGQGQLAYDIATTETYPGWGYMVDHGATTIWELWNGDTANPSMNSGNHVMLLGDLLPWCYENVAGIRPADDGQGFRRIVIQPDFSIARLTRVEASHHSPYGLIESAYERKGDRTEWTVTVPCNTEADLLLPNGKTKHVGSGTYRLKIKNKNKR